MKNKFVIHVCLSISKIVQLCMINNRNCEQKGFVVLFSPQQICVHTCPYRNHNNEKLIIKNKIFTIYCSESQNRSYTDQYRYTLGKELNQKKTCCQ